MRKMGILVGSFVLVLAAVSLGSAQQQQRKFGGGTGGFGFGGFGGGAQSPLTLLNRKDVQKELDVTDEQVEKIPDAVQKALADVLSEKQLKRLRQIDLQQRGTRAFTDAKVQKDLNITQEQGDNIKTILDDSRKEITELFKEAKGFGGGGGEKVTAINKEATEKIQGVLSADQRKQWKQMLGEEFKLETQGFGGGNFNKKKKTDNQE